MNVKEIVDNLNWEMWGEDGENNAEYDFVYSTNSVDEIVQFHGNNLEIDLWSSMNDTREVLDGGDCEPLEEFLIKQLAKEIAGLNVIGKIFKK